MSAIHGRYFQQVHSSSSLFLLHRNIFEQKLERLYEIRYSEEFTRRLETGNWHGCYYHCTGNCRCLEERIKTHVCDDQTAIHANLWCEREKCPIQGILSHGFLTSFNIKPGHFISKQACIASKYGIRKCHERIFLAIFICYARDIQRVNDGHSHVHCDEHVCPFYLAIIRV
ncbi:hypothetical protein BC939DRAFT_448327 [Gamsiella multidivaricata]|uniref:uncharacterized protein n=1 Tax=Gamsiella multidivaricata TaxID=101098 RepID=UPI00221F3BB9|nr:uncharacterized protein BC939DRAFT_448327 [Gamsiella multidivaricata]KAI7825748.1 hypothetical protein BC939DRAFT_448327 [Gamsiella multidivaricata]